MRFAGCVVIALWMSGVLMPATASAKKVTASVSFSNARSLATALYYPDDLALIRGVVVFTGGQGSGVSGDTRALVDQPFWQAFASSLGFAIMGTQFTGSYTDAAAGPGDALLDVLAALADKTGHPELEHAPLLLEGFSNGGYFSYTFTAFAPERVIAFCLNKSGFARAPLTDAFLAVPGFLIWGSEEPATGVPTVIHSLVQQARQRHALWAELKDWDRGHEEGKVERVFAPFFAEMIAARYPAAEDPRNGPVTLRALQETAGYLGDHSDASLSADLPTTAAYAAYSGDKLAASWLPSAGLAVLWRAFVVHEPLAFTAPTGGQISDATQPLQLTAAGLAEDTSARFVDGTQMLTGQVDRSSDGSAQSSWTPGWGGVRGLVALSVAADGTTERSSRPVHVVLQGKAAPSAVEADPVPVDAGVPDAGVSAEPDRDAGVDSSDAGPEAQADKSQLQGGCDVASPGSTRISPLTLAVGWLACASWRRVRSLLRIRAAATRVA